MKYITETSLSSLPKAIEVIDENNGVTELKFTDHNDREHSTRIPTDTWERIVKDQYENIQIEEGRRSFERTKERHGDLLKKLAE